MSVISILLLLLLLLLLLSLIHTPVKVQTRQHKNKRIKLNAGHIRNQYTEDE